MDVKEVVLITNILYNNVTKIVLETSVTNNCLGVINFLVENGAEINGTIALRGAVALYMSAEYSYLEIVKYLVENGVGINNANIYYFVHYLLVFSTTILKYSNQLSETYT